MRASSAVAIVWKLSRKELLGPTVTTTTGALKPLWNTPSRIVEIATKINPPQAHFHNTSSLPPPRDEGSTSSNPSNNMSGEVEAAKKAAASDELSEKDCAGPSTIFDKILSREWPSKRVYEDEHTYAFYDVNPQAPVHVIVIPKKKDGLVALSSAREDQKELLGHLLYVAQLIGKRECPNGFRLVINDGEHGAQSVHHLHVHVLGGRQMNWPPG